MKYYKHYKPKFYLPDVNCQFTVLYNVEERWIYTLVLKILLNNKAQK